MGKDAPVTARSGTASPSVDECLVMGLTCACYNLRRASRVVTQVFDSYFDDLGIKSTQYTVLAALSYESEGRPTVTHLADALVLEQSSLSRNLAVLERQGFVKLAAGEDDKRERIVMLTRAGRAALTRGYPVWKAAQAAIAEAVDPKELEVQLRSLRRLTKTAQALQSSRPERARPSLREPGSLANGANGANEGSAHAGAADARETRERTAKTPKNRTKTVARTA